MRTEVNYMERNAFEVIEQVVKNRLTKQKAAVILNCSIRTINRKIIRYKEDGINGFMHGNCNKKSNKAISRIIINKILRLRHEIYYDLSYIHFWEKLTKNHDIIISYKTLISILEKEYIISPFSHRSTRKKIAKKIMEDKTLNQQQINQFLNESILDPKLAHPLQPRKEYFGECVQTDASIHNWIDTEKWALHAFIDDSTGIVLSAYFDKQETLYGYYMATKAMFLEYGTPKEILTDKRTVFYSTRKNVDQSDANTQYGFMCNQLGITLSCTSVAQTKGKIERLWGSFQKRIPQELRLAGITDMNLANEWIKEFIKSYNQKHALKIDEKKNTFVPWESHEVDIDFALSTHYTRKALNGSTIKFENKNYATFDQYGKRINLAKKQDVMVVKTFTGEIFANYYTNFYSLIEINKEKFIAENINIEVSKINKTKTTNNKWKNSNWIMYQKKWKDHSSTYKFSIK